MVMMMRVDMVVMMIMVMNKVDDDDSGYVVRDCKYMLKKV